MNRLALALAGLALALSCRPPGAPSHATPPAHQLSILELSGGWRWIYRAEEPGTTRVEDETWRLRPDPASPLRLVGRYLRTVEVRSTDRVPFKCNQQLSYLQRALFDVVVERDRDRVVVRETAYKTEPSPCDHGFRHLGSYDVALHGDRAVLRWDAGAQTLWHVDNATAELPEPVWITPAEPTGAWRWQASSYDDDGNIRDEAEWWEITKRGDGRLDATYRRRVNVRSPDGAPIACANAPSWTFDDAYVLSGQREEEHWHFYELAVDPGDHPCTRTTPRRSFDEATAEQIGDFLVLEWRGKRRQILYRAP